jgi:SAM-dependent methyltransferase
MVYSGPRESDDLAKCLFYHTTELPDHELIEGNWDLRAHVDAYLGDIDFQGKRVLEIGTASGFLGFEMEKRGADVVAFDLAKDDQWDIVPFAGYEDLLVQRQVQTEQLNNAFWYCHKRMRSNIKMVYGNIYELPEEIGEVDISTFCSVLLHFRDPFLALQRGANLTKERMLVTETIRPREVVDGPHLGFLPDATIQHPRDTWWHLSPDIIVRMLGVLGFTKTSVTYHTADYEGRTEYLYTVVADRSSEPPTRAGRFVNSVWQLTRGQYPPQATANAWEKRLLQREAAARDFLEEALFSPDTPNSNDNRFIEQIYLGLFARIPDQESLVTLLAGMHGSSGRKAVVDACVASDEFREVCEQMNIDATR